MFEAHFAIHTLTLFSLSNAGIYLFICSEALPQSGAMLPLLWLSCIVGNVVLEDGLVFHTYTVGRFENRRLKKRRRREKKKRNADLSDFPTRSSKQATLVTHNAPEQQP